MEYLPSCPLSRRDLLQMGLSENRLRHLIRSGVLRVVFRGVYVRADIEDSVELRVRAAALLVGSEQIICDRSAAYLHGVDVYGSRERPEWRLETCVRSGGPNRHRGVDGRQRKLADGDVARLGSVPVTTPLRTALDLGCALPRHRALGAMDALAREHHFDRRDLQRECSRFRGRRGVIQLRELATLVDPRSESPRESWLRLVLFDARLPMPEVQWWVVEEGVQVYRLDFAYPGHLVAVEYDGFDHHMKTAEQIRTDHERRQWLAARGWKVIVVTKADLRHDVDAVWLSQLRELLRPQTRRFRWELGRRDPEIHWGTPVSQQARSGHQLGTSRDQLA